MCLWYNTLIATFIWIHTSGLEWASPRLWCVVKIDSGLTMKSWRPHFQSLTDKLPVSSGFSHCHQHKHKGTVCQYSHELPLCLLSAEYTSTISSLSTLLSFIYLFICARRRKLIYQRCKQCQLSVWPQALSLFHFLVSHSFVFVLAQAEGDGRQRLWYLSHSVHSAESITSVKQLFRFLDLDPASKL